MRIDPQKLDKIFKWRLFKCWECLLSVNWYASSMRNGETNHCQSWWEHYYASKQIAEKSRFCNRLSPHINGAKRLWGDWFERNCGRTSRWIGDLYSRKQNHCTESCKKIWNQQEYGTYRCNKIERFVWIISWENQTGQSIKQWKKRITENCLKYILIGDGFGFVIIFNK